MNVVPKSRASKVAPKARTEGSPGQARSAQPLDRKEYQEGPEGLQNAAAEFANVTVRLATPEDAAMLAKLRFDLRASLHELREDEAAFVERCTRWMRERLNARGGWQCWIAEREGTMVGSVWVQLIEKIPNPIAAPESYVYLTNFYVRPEHRSQGIGSKLLQTALSWSSSNNAELVLLWPTLRSKTLYERHGFIAADDFMELVL